jgi:hypothetical protein
MSIRSAQLVAAIAVLVPLSLLGCEEGGIPSPNADPAQATTAKPAASTEVKPTDSSKPEDGADKPDDKEAKADPKDGEEPKEGDAKEGEKAGASAKSADAKKADAAPKEAEPEPTKGEKKTAGSYAAWLQSSGKYAVDKPGAVVAVVNAQGEFKANDKYPYKFKVGSAPAGVTFASTTARGASVSKKSASLRIPFTPTSKGAKTISGTFYFSVCNAETCHIKKQPMSVTVNVE